MFLFCTPPVDIYGLSLLRVKQSGGGGGEGCRGSREVHKGSLFKFARHVEFANLTFENGRILSLTPLFVKRCLMLNPLSAIKLSPSLVLLDQSLEMKVKAAQGSIPTNNLGVLWCL